MSKGYSSSKSSSEVILLIQPSELNNRSTLLLFQTWAALFLPLLITAIKSQYIWSFCTLVSCSRVRPAAVFYSHTLSSTSITSCFGVSAFKVQVPRGITIHMHGWRKDHTDRWFLVMWLKLHLLFPFTFLESIHLPTSVQWPHPVAASWDWGSLS